MDGGGRALGCWVGVSKEMRRSFAGCATGGREGVWSGFGSNILLTRWIVFGGRARIVAGASCIDYRK